jgi:hypothetical protein
MVQGLVRAVDISLTGQEIPVLWNTKDQCDNESPHCALLEPVESISRRNKLFFTDRLRRIFGHRKE